MLTYTSLMTTSGKFYSSYCFTIQIQMNCSSIIITVNTHFGKWKVYNKEIFAEFKKDIKGKLFTFAILHKQWTESSPFRQYLGLLN